MTCCGQNSGIHGGSYNECRFLVVASWSLVDVYWLFKKIRATLIIKAAEPSETLYILLNYTPTQARSLSSSRFITLCTSQYNQPVRSS